MGVGVSCDLGVYTIITLGLGVTLKLLPPNSVWYLDLHR